MPNKTGSGMPVSLSPVMYRPLRSISSQYSLSNKLAISDSESELIGSALQSRKKQIFHSSLFLFLFHSFHNIHLVFSNLFN